MVIYRVGKQGVERIDTTGRRARKDLIVPSSKLDVRFDLESKAPAAARSAVMTVAWAEPPKIGISKPTLSLRVALRNRR